MTNPTTPYISGYAAQIYPSYKSSLDGNINTIKAQYTAAGAYGGGRMYVAIGEAILSSEKLMFADILGGVKYYQAQYDITISETYAVYKTYADNFKVYTNSLGTMAATYSSLITTEYNNQLSSLIALTTPWVTILSNKSSFTSGEYAVITFVLSESSTTFELADVVATGGILSNFSGTGNTYYAKFTPSSNYNGAATLNIANEQFSDLVGNPNLDGAYNKINLTVNTTGPTPDTTPPTVSTFGPADEATAVTIGSNIVVTFNETIQRGSGDIVLKTDSGTTVATYSQNSSNVTISASTLTINPTADLNYSTGYKVEFSAGSVKDTAGNNYAGTTTYNFTTGAAPDTTPPTVSTFSPADEATSVSIGSNIVSTFSEAIQRGTGDIVLKTAAGTTVATYSQTSSNVTISGNTLTINPSADLDYSTGYKVEFAAGSVKDVAGNNFAGTTTYNFTTDGQAAIKVSSGAIVSGVISQNTIWEGDITLSGSVKINPNVSLTILPGAHISAQAGKSIMIWADTGARLYANGNAQNQITFESTGDGSGQWMGVRLNGNTVDSSDVRAESKLSYVTIKEASVGVHVSSQSLTIDNANFNGNTYGLWLGKDVNGINVNKSNFDGSGISTSYESEVVGPYSSTNSWGSISNIKISNNEFSNAGISIWPNQRNVSNIKINNNKINSSATAIMVGGGGYGSHIGGLSVHDNEITAQTGFSIRAYSWLTGGVEIKNNKFMPGALNTNTGIFLDYMQGQPSGFSIEGNSFVNETYGIRGLDYYSSAAVLDVKGNLFIGNKTAIDVPKAKLNVSSNTFSGVTDYIYDHVYTTSTFANNNIFNFKGAGGFVRTRESVSGSNLSFNGNYFDATSSKQADYADDGSENFLYPTINFNGNVQNPNSVAVSYWPVWPNSKPVANNLTLALNEDLTNSGQLVATDTDSDTLVFSKASNPSNGVVTVNTNGTYIYTPNANFNGTDSFTFKANDGTIDSAVATVSITVIAVYDSPVASAASITTTEDTANTGTLTATDVDSTSLTFTKVASPTNGTVTVNTNGTYTYTPNANFNGTDSFTFKANDGAADSAAATVLITASAVNDSPVGTIDIIGTAKPGEKLTATRSFTDADGLPALGDLFKVTWLADGAPFTGTISGTALSDTGKFIASVLEVTADLVGKKLSFSTTYTDNGGTQETVTSAQTVAVVALKAGVTWSNASSLSTNESGTTATYGAVLDKAPTKDVTLTLTISDATEGVFVSTGTTTRDLVFTPSNWNQVQNVQVKGVDDGEYDRDVAYTISTKVTSNDLDYDGMRSGQGLATANVTVNNVDDDIPINWIGTDANDVKTGGPGADDLYGGYGRDDVSGGKGNDRIYGGYGDDVLSGDEGNDEIEGDQGDDRITAGAGDDNLKGGTGADTLFGGDGSDILNGGEDADSMDGGNGADTYYIDNPGDVVEDTGTDNSVDILYIASYLSAPVLLGRGVENATLNDSAGKGSITGNDSNNTLNGNASDNSLSGGSGNDTLESGAGNDSVDAGTGDDLIVGGEGAGNDTYVGGTGTDTVKYTSAVNTILVNLLTGLANGQDIGTDKLSQIENLIGGRTGDTLIGDDNANNINAYTGNDTITGNGGNDTVDGGEGQDTVVYALNASNYTVTFVPTIGNYFGAITSPLGSYQVVAKTGNEGTDTLLNVESLRFADKEGVIAGFVANDVIPTSAKFWKDNTKAPTDTKKADAVNLTDAIAILKMIVGLNVNSNNTPLSPYQAIAADFDQSGDVGLTDAIGVLKMVVGLSAPTPAWKYYDDTKLASTYTSAQSLNPKGWTTTAAISDTATTDNSVKLIGVLTGDVDGSWTGV